MQTFEWHEVKAQANLVKHGVSFDVVIAVWLDPNRIEIDASHPSGGKVRLKTVGLIGSRFVTVVYTVRALKLEAYLRPARQSCGGKSL